MRVSVIVSVGLFLMGMAVWIFLFKILSEMADDISNGICKTPVIKKVVVKYDDCKKLDITVNNAAVFVEKILENEKFCGLRLREWTRLGGAFKYVIVMSFAASLFFIPNDYDEISVCLAVAVMSIAGLRFMEKVAGINEYYMEIRIGLVDYLENSGGVRHQEGKVIASRLKGKSASDFVKMAKQYDKISAASTLRR